MSSKRLTNKISILLILNLAVSIASANICQRMAGDWSGQWENQQKVNDRAKLTLLFSEHQKFSGKFELANGSKGTIHGRCIQRNTQEAYLELTPDPPWYNPCRGTVIELNKKMVIHFFCFQPNEAGYFNKLQVE